MHTKSLLALAAVLVPLGAAAQSPYEPVLVQPQAFQPLPLPGGGPVTAVVTSSTDDGSADALALPFPFEFHGTVYNTINVGTNGYATFGADTGAVANARSLSNQILPSATNPSGLVAVWWDDQVCPAGSINTQVVGSAPGRTFVVEWRCNRFSTAANTWEAQLHLVEGASLIRVAYGNLVYSGAGTQWTATVGIENQTGTIAATPALPGPACTNTCADVNWPAQSMLQYGTPAQAELIPSIEVVSTTAGAGTLDATLRTTVRNIGLTPAASIGWELFESTDAVLDASDTLLASHPAVESVGAQSTASFDDPITGPRPPGTTWYCVRIDPTNLVTEAIEGNNVACLLEPLLVGIELSGSIAVPPLGSPGDTLPIDVTVRNRGIDPSGPFLYRIYLSADATLDGGDVMLHEDTLDLAGGSTFAATLDLLVPINLQGDTTRAILEIDPAGAVAELDEANQVAVSPTAADMVRPDIRVSTLSVDLPDGCFFGSPVAVEYELCNDGGGAARNFATAVSLSDNAVLTIYDPQALAVPESCLGGDASACTDLGGGAPVCHLDTCHAPCATDADCGGDLLCREDPAFPGTTACQAVVEVGACVTYRRTFDLPATDGFGAALEEGTYFFGVLADWTDTVYEDDEGNQLRRTEVSYLCRHPAMDVAAVSLVAPPRLAAGEAAPVFRVVENLGIVGGTASYRYYLSSNEIVSAEDIPLAVAGGAATVELARGALDERTDLVIVPGGIAEGDYWLGLVLDPDGAIDELDESNNVAVGVVPVHVEPSTLRVATTRLPDAVVGLPYAVHVLAAGGQGGFEFSLRGEPPPGLSLAADGLLGGTPLAAGVHALEVEVRSAGAEASSVIALRIRPPAGPLAVATDVLPPAYVGVPYLVPLAASGGEPPYTWTIEGALPAGLELRNGVVAGDPREAGEPVAFVAYVTDAAGTVASAPLELQVVQAADLSVSTSRLPEGELGQPYLGCASATGGDGSYAWTVDPATAPPGLAPLAGSACLEGTPLACGTFTVSVSVADGAGLSDAAELPLTVFCDDVALRTGSLDAVHRGDVVDVALEASEEGVTFRLATGRLPKGLGLSEDGRISGTVAEDAAFGVHAFAVELEGAQGGRGLAALSLEVLAEPAPPVTITEIEPPSGGCGCAADASAPGFGALAVGLLALARLLRGRRALAAAALPALALLAPAAALAQGSPYSISTFSAPYQPLAAPLPVPSSGSAHL